MVQFLKKSICMMVTMFVICSMVSCGNVDPVMERSRVTNFMWSGADSIPDAHLEGTSTIFPLSEWLMFVEEDKLTSADSLLLTWRHQLTKNVYNYLEFTPDSVTFSRVKGDAFGVQSGDGKRYDGQIGWQILVNIFHNKTIDRRFLVCGNGLTEGRFSEDVLMANAVKTGFRIKKDEGLAHHLPELKEWGEVAATLQIPIKDASGKIVDANKYLNFLGEYVSCLFEGDSISLISGEVFNAKGQHVDFERRQKETAKSNSNIAKSKKKKTRR